MEYLVFISYAHADKKWYDDLKDRLAPYLRRRPATIKVWSDQDIEPGAYWFDEILRMRDAARVAILLVSHKFLRSNFIGEHELEPFLARAKEDRVRILWIPLSACAYKEFGLRDIQALIDPIKPLDRMRGGSLGSAWQMICEKIAGSLANAISPKIPVVVQNRDRIDVKLARDCESQDVIEALWLYDERIPEQERFSADDILRWLRDDRDNPRRADLGPSDLMFIATMRKKVCGLALLHYMPQDSLAFVAYMASKKGVRDREGRFVSRRLIDEVAAEFSRDSELRKCGLFLTEVDDPRHLASGRHQAEALARIKLFSLLAQARGFSLRIVGIDYRQPLLHVPKRRNQALEVPMLLMVASKNASNEFQHQEVIRLLTFIHERLYPEGFSDDPAQVKAYRAYLTKLLVEQVKRLPKSIRALSADEVFRRIPRGKRRRRSRAEW
ncbi:MAG: toll/interleukin-1 receptor domain-containing protein [Pirellulales bacterium]